MNSAKTKNPAMQNTDSSHTPGPWKSFPSNVVRDSYGVEIAAVSYKAHPQECEANAKLIAAAPELLEALKSLMAVMDRAGWMAPLASDKAHAAIAKATAA